MHHLSKFACIVFGAAVLLTGCKGKDGDPGPAGAAGQNLAGNITGFVNSVDESGQQLTKAGVLVTVDGSTPAITATSDADGRFTLNNVRNGTYNLTFTRAGYSTFRRIGVGHVGGDQATFLGTITLSQVSSQTISSLTSGTFSTTSVNVNLTINSPTPTTLFRAAFFASTSPNPTSATGTLITSVSFGTGGGPVTSYQTMFGINRFSFNNAGFASGTTVYLAAFGSTSFFASYIDLVTGRVIFPTFNTTSSPVITVVIP